MSIQGGLVQCRIFVNLVEKNSTDHVESNLTIAIKKGKVWVDAYGSRHRYQNARV